MEKLEAANDDSDTTGKDDNGNFEEKSGCAASDDTEDKCSTTEEIPNNIENVLKEATESQANEKLEKEQKIDVSCEGTGNLDLKVQPGIDEEEDESNVIGNIVTSSV